MKPIQFSADINVLDLAPATSKKEQKIRAAVNRLREKYKNNENLTIKLQGLESDHYDLSTEEKRPKVIAYITVKPLNGKELTDTVVQNVGEFISEPLWKFFWRIKKSANSLIKVSQ